MHGDRRAAGNAQLLRLGLQTDCCTKAAVKVSELAARRSIAGVLTNDWLSAAPRFERQSSAMRSSTFLAPGGAGGGGGGDGGGGGERPGRTPET